MADPRSFAPLQEASSASQRPSQSVPKGKRSYSTVVRSGLPSNTRRNVASSSTLRSTEQPCSSTHAASENVSKAYITSKTSNPPSNQEINGPPLPTEVIHLPSTSAGYSTVHDLYTTEKGWVRGAQDVRDLIADGAIILAVQVGPLLDSSITPGDTNRSENISGALFAKKRFFIVISKRERHLTALPIFTHSNQGISHLYQEVQKEYIRLSQEAAPHVPNEPHSPLIIEPGKWKPKPEAYVQFTRPYCIDYACPILR